MSYNYRRRFPVQAQVAAWIVGAVMLIFVMVISGDVITKDRYCFEAGGRVVDNVCMPVDGSINLQNADQNAGR